MPTLGSILKDVRALGTSAPLRAVYEVSKRTDGHSLLFRPVAGGHVSRPLPFGHHLPQTEASRQRCLEDAQLILGEGTRVFGRRVATGSTASWAMDPLTERCWPETTPWWQIDIRSDARLSDVKFVWESARHRDLVILARAATLEPDGPWLPHLEAMLIRWCRECQPEQGVNWYSSLELALRAIAWNQVLQLVGDRLHGGLRAELDDQLVASARHIMVELPYTVSSMKNNHLLGDGLGLVVLGTMFPSHPGATRWRTIGDRLMLKQLQRHMMPDGSMIEDSLSYHRFVLEMFIVRVLVGDAPREVRQAMKSAARHLVRLGVLDGAVPQYGDWDEGRVLSDSAPAGDVAGAALLGLHLSGEQVPSDAWDRYDELAWYADPTSGELGDVAVEHPAGAVWESGHFSGVAKGPWRVWLKRNLTQSHQHADLTSVWISHEDTWVVQDPGTGTYNGPLEVRDGFRTSAAHPVWRPAGGDLLGPHRAFRWERATVPCGSGRGAFDDIAVLVSWHEAFDEGRTLRVVLVGDGGVTVLDRLPDGARGWTLSVPHGPASDQLAGLGEAVEGEGSPFAGWLSDTYGEWHPSPWSMASGDAGWHVWGVGSMAAVEALDSDRLAASGVSLRVSSHPDVVIVELSQADRSISLEAKRA